jgi:hypothetical protein
MKNTIGLLGTAAGALGVLVCAISGIVRVSGQFYLGGFEAMTLFNGGIGLMVAGCLFRLHALEQR